MEEVWNDYIHHDPTPNNSHFKGGVILQDFFSSSNCNCNHEEEQSRRRNPTTITSPSSSSEIIMPPKVRPPPPPTTEFQFLESQHFDLQGNHSSSVAVPGFITAADDAFDALASSSLLTSFGSFVAPPNHNKRLSQGDDDSSTATALVDRRHKRMIKNRESAARSRARKQAYITELELEVNNLLKENEMLRKQQQQMQFLIEAPATQLPKKNGLHRTTTF